MNKESVLYLWGGLQNLFRGLMPPNICPRVGGARDEFCHDQKLPDYDAKTILAQSGDTLILDIYSSVH